MVYDPSRFRDYFEHSFSYDAGFRRNVARYGNSTAMLDPQTGRSWTYEQLEADVQSTASMLADRGVGRGDRVVYQLMNTPEFAMLYLATQRLGAIGGAGQFPAGAGRNGASAQGQRPAGVHLRRRECRKRAGGHTNVGSVAGAAGR
ncbi:AMP-binding protein [Arthrobacter castelli]|uniref:AMP-binding protein n=1 Tax=Arthrobacter castelli TaxID=271431 RepID=UPI00247FEAC0|nr:AMP-binding protein [Arthrobacter castelli]